MILVIIHWQASSQQVERWMAAVPRIGEGVRLNGDPGGPSLQVEDVLWLLERKTPSDPAAIIAVRERTGMG